MNEVISILIRILPYLPVTLLILSIILMRNANSEQKRDKYKRLYHLMFTIMWISALRNTALSIIFDDATTGDKIVSLFLLVPFALASVLLIKKPASTDADENAGRFQPVKMIPEDEYWAVITDYREVLTDDGIRDVSNVILSVWFSDYALPAYFECETNYSIDSVGYAYPAGSYIKVFYSNQDGKSENVRLINATLGDTPPEGIQMILNDMYRNYSA